ncbi:hypothetical protein RJ639_008779 [Escallonia herrerae]|uniref:Xylanase inhibitor N-terminal domain-containing protein n=1 Tax=Escallonia herrerae TaxID=1293975 RepID=A0AA89ATR0_9ASTE|nr:hypothetical protein RJ639_008779 [Escallonia herrerae]
MIPTPKTRRPYQNGIRTSLARAYVFSKLTSVPSEWLINALSPVAVIGMDFVMSYSIGTLPVQTFGVDDTASHVIWLQCQPCVHCYEQSVHFYNYKNSGNYGEIDFGLLATTPGPTTPLVPNDYGHYLLRLKAIMVSGQDIFYGYSDHYQTTEEVYEGGFTIDTGTIYVVLDAPISKR